MYCRIFESTENIIDLTKNGKVDVLVRFANCNNNWTSPLDKELVKAFPDLEEADIDKEIGKFNSYNKKIDNLFFMGNKIVTFINAYVYKEKDIRGRYKFDIESFYKIMEELDKNHRGRIICFDFKHETSIDKIKIIKQLGEIIKFSKVIICS